MSSAVISSVDTMTERTERLLGLSDAVFAFAITFLALDLSELPDGEDIASVGDYLHEHLPDYLVYIATFTIIGFLWWRHHLIFRYIKIRSGKLMWVNLLLLAMVAALPYPAGVVSESFGLGLSLVILLVPLTIAAICLLVMWEMAIYGELAIPHLPNHTRSYMRSTLLSTPIVMLLALTLAFISYKLDSQELCYIAAASGLLLLIVPAILRLRWPPPEQAIMYKVDEKADHDDKVVKALEEAEKLEEKATDARSALLRLRNGSDANRLTVFTDGVVAIAVTIIALQLTPPDRTEAVSNDVLWENLNTVPVMPYLTTFFLICLFWQGHVRMFEVVVGVDTILLWLNLAFLMFVAFLPFPSDLLGHTDDRSASTLYFGVMLVMSLIMLAMSAYSVLARHISVSKMSPQEDRREILSMVFLPIGFVVTMVMINITGNASWAWSILVILVVGNRLMGRSHDEAKAHIHHDGG